MSKAEKVIITGKEHGTSHKIISLRIKVGTFERLEKTASQSSCSKSEIINRFIEYGLENYVKKE